MPPKPDRETETMQGQPGKDASPPSHGVDIKSALRKEDAVPERPAEPLDCLQVKGLNLFYGQKQALHDINLTIPERYVTAFIGPSGCGKSTLLRCFNRMNDLIDGVRVEGEVLLDGQNIFAPEVNVATLRRRVGMVFQKSTPFPK